MKRVQTEATWLRDLQELVSNPLPLDQLKERWFAAIIGDTPSKYAKSPVVWNAAFQAFGLPAFFVPLDVPAERLRDVVGHLKEGERVLGFSVTVPYKNAILPLLDELDPLASRIGAVNTVARGADGQWMGYNTDALGALRTLTEPILPNVPPLISSIENQRILLIGSGGAAQAVACVLWERLGHGELILTNRTLESAERLKERLLKFRLGNLRVVSEDSLEKVLAEVTLVINASTKGQAGIRTLPGNQATCLEPYSALAAAHPAVFQAQESSDPSFGLKWLEASSADIQQNHGRSLELFRKMNSKAACFDLIYAPLETTFLRHARWRNLNTLNGKGMNIAQAADAFFRKVCKGLLEEKGLSSAAHERQLIEAMVRVWDNPEFSGGKLETLAQVEQTKSLVARRDLPAGHSLKREDLVEAPPLRGITARHLEFVIGKRLLYPLKTDDPITFGVLQL